jgi:hypothetical protein
LRIRLTPTDPDSRRLRARYDLLGIAAGLLVGWGALGQVALGIITRLASSGAEALDRFGYRAAPGGLAFGLVLGFLFWSFLWTAAGVACARGIAAAVGGRRDRRVSRAS